MHSRQAIKKYVKANNTINTPSGAQFDSLFNKALKSGVEKGDFAQPKGASGPVKLAKKEAKPEKKAAPKVR
jgi:histone H1/5